MQDVVAMPVLNSEVPSSTPMIDPRAVSALSDEQQMQAVAKGSAEAFTELFSRYKQPIYAFFRRRLPEGSHAEELTQETFLVLFRSASRYEPRALFRTYLYAIAFKILRAHRRKLVFRAAFFPQAPFQKEPATTDATESSLWIRRAVAKLDPTDREILLLREFEQLSYAEIGNLLHIPLNTVRSRLFRARTALRALLDPTLAQDTALSSTQLVPEKEERP